MEEIINESNVNDKCLTIIYKMIGKKKIIKLIERSFKFYDDQEYDGNVLRIFGKDFVKQHKNKCKLIYKNKKLKLKEYLEKYDEDYYKKKENIEIKIKLFGINNITSMKKMFYGCIHLLSVSVSPKDYDYQKNDKSINILDDSSLNILPVFNENKNINIHRSNIYDLLNQKLNEKSKQTTGVFNNNILSSTVKYSSQMEISSTLKYIDKNIPNNLESSFPYLNKVKNMSWIFSGCISLISLSGLSEWNTSNVTDMQYMFNNCISLLSLPDISKWNTSNVTNIQYMFSNCNLVKTLPDLSKWNTSKVTNMCAMFFECHSLVSLPDLSR